MSPASLRGYRASDAEHLSAIYINAVMRIGPRAYSPEQVAAWASRAATPAETHERCCDGRSVWVAVDEADKPIGFIDLEADGHIDMMFCTPEWAGKGLASALYKELEKAAAAHAMARLYVEASELAMPFFGRRGFNLLHRNDIEANGITVHNYAMEKILQVRQHRTG